ncbi:trypsin alpha-3-like [Bactrocera dorsalis]|uniref:Trypsin alpha-3-like n=1 Tax=Bactrocera dorsalis TaxID=27457 RepID=A0A6I9UVC4_BACDO|nr:trypsin alpha-3-like [Bactrocera dorsalis]
MSNHKTCSFGILLIYLVLYNYFPHITATNITIADQVPSLTKSTITKKIIGGDFVALRGAPFMVNLRRDDEFICGGTLLRHNCVLTAAHCVVGTSASRLDIQAGSTLLSNSSQRSAVQSIFIPRQYRKKTNNFDVAILRLDTSLTGQRVQLVKLSNAFVRPGQRARVYGWGNRREDGRSAVGLRAAVVRVIRRSKCNREYRQDGEDDLSRTMFCASLPGINDSCAGDSGGPLMFRGRQYGIVSWGTGCGRANYPGVYTSIRAVQPWINRIVAQHCQ